MKEVLEEIIEDLKLEKYKLTLIIDTKEIDRSISVIKTYLSKYI